MEKDKLMNFVLQLVNYRLIFQEPRTDITTKDLGENVFLEDLTFDYKIFLFYYPAVMPNEELEEDLRKLGKMTGKNLLVNIGQLNDPNFELMVEKFRIVDYPVIIITAVKELASIKEDDSFPTAFVKIDNKKLLSSRESVRMSIERLFSLFMAGKISEAMERSKKDGRDATLSNIRRIITDTMKQIAGYLSERDITVSLLEGKFEIKKNT